MAKYNVTTDNYGRPVIVLDESFWHYAEQLHVLTDDELLSIVVAAILNQHTEQHPTGHDHDDDDISADPEHNLWPAHFRLPSVVEPDPGLRLDTTDDHLPPVYD